jgi:hypothetical protein
VKVGDEHVKALSGYLSQSFCYAISTDNVKSSSFQPLRHHGADSSVIIYQQNSGDSLRFGRSHTAPPLVTNNANASINIPTVTIGDISVTIPEQEGGIG